MEVKVNYTIVGLAVVILGAAFVATLLWLSVGFNNKTYTTYAIFLKEAASGLSKDAPVRFSGVKVGVVKQISLNHNNPQQVIILLNIEEGTPITTNTSATLISQGLTGISYIGLAAKGPNLTPLKAQKGYPYPIIPAKPSLFNQVDKAVQEVSDNIEGVSLEIKRVFDKENATHLKNSLANLSEITEVIADNVEQIQNTLIHVEKISTNFARASKDLPQLINHFDTMSTSIKIAGDKVAKTMDDSSNAITKIAQRTVPTMNILMEKLNTIADNFEQISVMMRRNPSVIVRGTAPIKPGPGEQ